jgi:hypothetical protein
VAARPKRAANRPASRSAAASDSRQPCRRDGMRRRPTGR